MKGRFHQIFMALVMSYTVAFEFAAHVEAFSSPSNTRHFHRSVVVPNNVRLFSSPETAADTTPPSKQSILPKKVGINGAAPQQSKFPSQFSINVSNMVDRIRQISNFASFLCALDCTILPIITVALPLLGVLNLGSSQLHALHELGHSLALYFVLPVGSLTTVMNYMSHRKSWIAAMAISGLLLVGLANSHLHLSGIPQALAYALNMAQNHSGPWHRVVNISGCAFLLGSNYLSQQQGCAHHNHDHHDCNKSGSKTSSVSNSCSHEHTHDEHDHDH